MPEQNGYLEVGWMVLVGLPSWLSWGVYCIFWSSVSWYLYTTTTLSKTATKWISMSYLKKVSRISPILRSDTQIRLRPQSSMQFGPCTKIAYWSTQRKISQTLQENVISLATCTTLFLSFCRDASWYWLASTSFGIISPEFCLLHFPSSLSYSTPTLAKSRTANEKPFTTSRAYQDSESYSYMMPAKLKILGSWSDVWWRLIKPYVINVFLFSHYMINQSISLLIKFKYNCYKLRAYRTIIIHLNAIIGRGRCCLSGKKRTSIWPTFRSTYPIGLGHPLCLYILWFVSTYLIHCISDCTQLIDNGMINARSWNEFY